MMIRKGDRVSYQCTSPLWLVAAKMSAFAEAIETLKLNAVQLQQYMEEVYT